MANKYANLVGTNKIKDEYTKINTGFDGVETDIDALNYLVDALDSRVDTIITTPIDGEAAAQEIVDARVSAVKSKTFASLDARFEETEQDIATHLADSVTDEGGIHGLEIESGTFTPSITGTSTAGEATYAYRIGKYYKIGKLVHIEIYLSWTAHTGTGNMEIYGLPFPVASSPGGHQVTFAISPYRITLSDGHIITGYSGSGGTGIALRQYNSAEVFIPIPMDTGAQIRVVGSYLTN